MNKLGPKLIAATMAVVLAVVMSVMVTYAWTVLSTAPVAEGIQITIGGSNTILVAPDLTKTVDGKTYHFPGGFSGKLNFSHHEAYAYLSEIASLMPVSTADGKHWIIPEYYDILDEAVLNGEACVGVMKPMEEFTVDTQLQYANLTEFSASGSYVYLDFWVVSPGTEYTLRMSHGDENGGSYLLELMDAAETADGGFVLTATEGTAAATARIGFLVNSNPAGETALSCYRESATFSDQYRKLVGVFEAEQTGGVWQQENFTIYEPNGDVHPNGENGTYVLTRPLGIVGGRVQETDIWNCLSVSLENRWKQADAYTPPIDELFQAALLGKNINSAQEAEHEFYNKYLQGQFMPYVDKGQFIQSTASLQGYCYGDGMVSIEEMRALQTAGATDDISIVTLQKNVPQRIRMFLWLEGQDVDCANTESPINFAVSIELAGSNWDQ
ncbi:MAG: hypothetical protein IJC93_04900 [Clostridia bacterium]|nr:hypothetical protein [Clostridia bacterium]